MSKETKHGKKIIFSVQPLSSPLAKTLKVHKIERKSFLNLLFADEIEFHTIWMVREARF